MLLLLLCYTKCYNLNIKNVCATNATELNAEFILFTVCLHNVLPCSANSEPLVYLKTKIKTECALIYTS